MVGQNKALQSLFGMNIEVFGLEDDLSERDVVDWYPVSVKTCMVKGPKSFGYAPKLVDTLREAKLDLVHAHGLWMYPSVACSRWARFHHKPYVLTTHGMLAAWAVDKGRAKKWLAGWLYQNAQLRDAACFQAVTMSEVRAIRAYGLWNPICLIPHGVEVPSESSHLAEHMGRPKELLYLGRLHPHKGLVNLLRGWHALRKSESSHLKDWILTIAGWGQDGHEIELRTLSSDLGIQENVRFIGPKFGSEKTETFCSADAFILPSLGEALPVAALEAWAYKLPALLTPECNIPEGYETGAAIRIGTDPQTIAAGIGQLITMSQTERQSMGLRGRDLVEKRFSWPTIAGQIYSVYRWVLGGGVKPDCIVD
ncbi:MAG: glycosyltransferase [Nitrospirae bacterium]|nr:glycosyltransferase [Nitrospirota bacterium]